MADIVVRQIIQLRDARLDVDAWRLLAEQALSMLGDQHRELEAVRARYHALLEERRRERADQKAAA